MPFFSGMGVHAGQQCIEASVSVSPESGEITVQGSAAMRQPIVLLLISADTDEALLDTLDDQDAEKAVIFRTDGIAQKRHIFFCDNAVI